MFLHLSVILFTGGGSAPLHAGIHRPSPGPEAGTPPGGDTTPGSRHPSGTRQPPRTRHSPAQCMLGNKQAVRILVGCNLVCSCASNHLECAIFAKKMLILNSLCFYSRLQLIFYIPLFTPHRNSVRCTVIKVPHPKREGGPVLLLQNYPHPLNLRGRGPYHFPTPLNT